LAREAPEETPRVLRRRTGRVIGGVAGGLADHLDVSVLWVRVTFAILTVFAGAGLALYALLWVFVRQEPTAPPREVPPRERQQALALIALGIGLLVGAGALSGTVSNWVAVPLGVVLVGVAVVWREADEAQRRRWVHGARTGVTEMVVGSTGGRTVLLRLIAGGVLVAVGIGLLLLHGVSLGQGEFALLAVLATLVGVAVLTVPWWLRLVRDLGDERRARIRHEERAEIAAHLHDSVLQTLALIQKQSESSREVLRLARGQERQLRTWLYGPGGYGRVGGSAAKAGVATEAEIVPTTVAEALALAGGEVEDTFAIAVRPVVVGDAPMDVGMNALVQAAREAMVNAAKHSGEAEISVYAEVEPEQVTVFVRDRGKGFEPDAVPEDRHGLADSIRGRMDRHGGSVTLKTGVGDGTEVQLTMPRAVAAKETKS
jgi:signal transduction histidine kinase